jgi:MFS family permease
MSTVAAPSARLAVSTRRHAVAFWVIAFALLTILAYGAVPTPLYPLYQARDGFSSLTVTVVFAVYAVGVVISLFTVGHLSDWHGRRWLVVPAHVPARVGLLVFAVVLGAAALVAMPFVLAGVRKVEGETPGA